MYPQADYTLWKFVRTNEKGWTAWFTLVVLFYFLVIRWWWGDGWWPVDVFLGLLTGLVWLRAYLLRKKLRGMNEAGSSNKHRSDVCEGCDPPCWKDGRPLTEFYQWYAAIMDETWDRAKLMIAATPMDEVQELVRRHAEYLKDKKFEKFK